MVQLREVLERLATDYPELNFRVGKKFMFRPPRTIVYAAGSEQDSLAAKRPENMRETAEQDPERGVEMAEQEIYRVQRLLHEVGHALSKHVDYALDIERVKMEREAWGRARGLCARYGVEYDEEFVEAQLDTYREWLHRRAVCRGCGMVRYQDGEGRYHCPACEEYGVGD